MHSQSQQAPPTGPRGSRRDVSERINDIRRRGHARRISYFMLFRLVMLAGFTVLAGFVAYTSEEAIGGFYSWFIWGTLATGYLMTLLFAWWLPRVEDLDAFARIQTTTDISLSALVVQMTGGVDSGFSFLYLLAVLGAATMGDRRHIWAAASACVVLYGTLSVLEFAQVLPPFTPHGRAVPLPPLDLWYNVVRTMAALLGVTALSSFLNTQLASSVSQVGSLRALNENIVRSLNSGLLTTDERGCILYFNPAAAHILRLDERCLGVPADEVIPGIDRLLQSPTDESSARHDLEVQRDSDRIHLGLSVVPLLDENGRRIGSVTNFQDVTKLHELSRRVRRNERLAAIGGLAASVAHEIRNPLAAISGSADLLTSDSLTAEDRRLLGIVRRESGRLESLVSDLLSFTRPKSSDCVTLNLSRAVEEVRDSFLNDPANARLVVEVEHHTQPLYVWADPSQITQVLWNLLRNAAEATGGRGTITVRLSASSDRIRMSIIDDGPGIPAEVLERVFDPFFTTKPDGTGFGLAIVHRIVEEHDGTIQVATPSQGGTELIIELPSAEARKGEDSRDEGEPEARTGA